MSFSDDLETELAELGRQDRLRSTRPLSGADRVRPITPSNTRLVAFCSNDYLGLASHPAVVAAAEEALRSDGLGAGAARLVSGDSHLHHRLEAALADLTGSAAALLFPTGYQANIGVITALTGADDTIVSDAANHASIVDGCRLSRARIAVYPHGDVAAADRALAAASSSRRRLLVTESLFSMDGDRAPLASLATIARRHDAVLVVDEAHALGVAGPEGRGLCAASSIQPDVLIGTLGKAFGAAGGFAAGSRALRDVLLNRARTFIFATASPPSLAAAAAAAIDLARGPEGNQRRALAHAHAVRLRAGLRSAGHTAAGEDLILPVILGTEARALAASAGLLDRGLLVPAIRPPTVPRDTARLRITVSAAHTAADIDVLLAAISELNATASTASATT